MTIRSNIHFRDGTAQIDLDGHLDFETSAQLENSLDEIVKTHQDIKLVFNLNDLQFVGSCGISQFIKMLKPYNRQKNPPVFIGLNRDFAKLFRALEGKVPFDIR